MPLLGRWNAQQWWARFSPFGGQSIQNGFSEKEPVSSEEINRILEKIGRGNGFINSDRTLLATRDGSVFLVVGVFEFLSLSRRAAARSNSSFSAASTSFSGEWFR